MRSRRRCRLSEQSAHCQSSGRVSCIAAALAEPIVQRHSHGYATDELYGLGRQPSVKMPVFGDEKKNKRGIDRCFLATYWRTAARIAGVSESLSRVIAAAVKMGKGRGRPRGHRDQGPPMRPECPPANPGRSAWSFVARVFDPNRSEFRPTPRPWRRQTQNQHAGTEPGLWPISEN
jgi:hypothetical protein